MSTKGQLYRNNVPVRVIIIRMQLLRYLLSRAKTYCEFLLQLFWVVVTIGLFLGGCVSKPVSYNTLTVMEGTPRFTVEYPDRYDVVRKLVDEKGIVREIRLHYPGTSSVPPITSITIYFYLFEYIPDPITKQKDFVRMASRINEFRLLEERTVSVAGLPAEMAVTSDIIENVHGFKTSGKPTITASTVFAKGNYLGVIDMHTLESWAGDEKRDYEHFLSSFRFLD